MAAAAAAAPKPGSFFNGTTQILNGLSSYVDHNTASQVQTQSGVRTFSYVQVKARVAQAFGAIDRASPEESEAFLTAATKAAERFKDLIPSEYCPRDEASARPSVPSGRVGALPYVSRADLDANIVNRVSRFRPANLD